MSLRPISIVSFLEITWCATLVEAGCHGCKDLASTGIQGYFFKGGDIKTIEFSFKLLTSWFCAVRSCPWLWCQMRHEIYQNMWESMYGGIQHFMRLETWCAKGLDRKSKRWKPCFVGREDAEGKVARHVWRCSGSQGSVTMKRRQTFRNTRRSADMVIFLYWAGNWCPLGFYTQTPTSFDQYGDHGLCHLTSCVGQKVPMVAKNRGREPW